MRGTDGAPGPDALARDLPAAFPEWLKRRYPTLRAEETNVLFQAFRRRRVIYHPSLRARLRNSFDPRVWGVAGSIAAVVITVVLSPFLFGRAGIVVVTLFSVLFWPLVIGVGVLMFSMRNARRKKGDAPFLPARLGSVFGEDGYQLHAAIDVWMTGCTGREVAEAIFLENYERWFRGFAYAAFGLVLVPSAMVLYFARKDCGWPEWLVPVFGCASAWSLWSLMLAQLHDVQGTRQLEKRYSYWKSRSAIAGAIGEFGRLVGENIVQSVVSAAIMAGFLAVGGLCIYLTVDDFSPLRHTRLRAFLVGHPGASLFTLGFLLFGAFCQVMRLAWARKFVARYERALGDAEYPFALLMTSVVLGDPEGEAWARWRYGKVPTLPPVPLRPPPPPMPPPQSA